MLINHLFSRLDDAIFIFHVEPPLFLGMVPAGVEKIRASNGHALRDPGPHHHAPHQVVRPGGGIAPRAAFNTPVAHGPVHMGKVVTGAAFRIQFPGLITVVDDFIPAGDGLAGAVLGTDLAVLAKGLQAKIDGLVRDYGISVRTAAAL